MTTGRKQQTPTIKSVREIDLMRKAGHIIADVLDILRDAAKPGVTTAQLDEIAGREIRGRGGVPSFLGYQGYVAHICTSINEQIVHGIPGPRVIKNGDVLSIDCGAIYDGYQGDSAITIAIGDVTKKAQDLIEDTRRSMVACIDAARAGNGLADLTNAIKDYAAPRSYGIIRGYGGHGIGTAMHEEPWVPNNIADFDRPNRRALSRFRLRPGLTLALEPMLTLGDWRTQVGDDDWTVSTVDGSLSAHWEHTIVVTEDGPEVLTSRTGRA